MIALFLILVSVVLGLESFRLVILVAARAHRHSVELSMRGLLALLAPAWVVIEL